MKQSQRQPCPGCNGTGQMTWFGGVSRFQFSYTDCPECNGFGFLEQTANTSLQAEDIENISSLSTEKTHDFLEALAQILSKTLVQGESIKLRGFGSFSCSSSSSVSKTKISFSPAKQLLKTLNK
jgi:hypothetical protein